MGALLGLLNIQDADRVYISTVGQSVIYDAAKTLFDRYNAELKKVKDIFVERATSDHALRYKLPGGGRLQKRGGLARSSMQKAGGSWDIALPLEEWGAAIGEDKVSMAYMTVGEIDRRLDTIFLQDTNTVRYELLKALFNNADRTYEDDIWGTLTIKPLANGDAVVYPPVVGSETGATDDHYLNTGYAVANISDANNPFPVVRDELQEHFGVPQGGSNIVSFVNTDVAAKAEGLADFTEVGDRYVKMGDEADSLTGLPAGMPGRVVGRTNGVWVVEWRWIPAGYMIALDMDAPKPLIERHDPAETGLGSGLELFYEEESEPINTSSYRRRSGWGVGNRLNGVCVEVSADGAYTVPTGY